MFTIEEEVKTISMYMQTHIISAILQVLHPSQVHQVRQILEPHWSDNYYPSLDRYFNNHTCLMCGDRDIVNRKYHFHSECEAVKARRDQCKSIEEFELGA